jgi:SPRY domain/F-box domain
MDNNNEFLSSPLGGSIGCTIQPLSRRSPKRSKHEKGTSSPISTIPCYVSKNSRNKFARLLNSELNAGVALESDWPSAYDEWESYTRNEKNLGNCVVKEAGDDDRNCRSSNYSFFQYMSLRDDNATESSIKIDSNCRFDGADGSCLPIEVSLNILSYLDLKTLLSVRAVNQTMRNVLQSEDSNNGLWMSLYQTNWTFLRDLGMHNLKLDDSFDAESAICIRPSKERRCKTADGNTTKQSQCWPNRSKRNTFDNVVSTGKDSKETESFSSPSKSKSNEINHAMILSLAAATPTSIDEAQIKSVQKRIQRRRFQLLRSQQDHDEHPGNINFDIPLEADDAVEDSEQPPMADMPRRNNPRLSADEIHFVSIKISSKSGMEPVTEEVMEGLQYTGPVGEGDRCIRANHPLPRPQHRAKSNRDVSFAKIYSRLMVDDDSEDGGSDMTRNHGRVVGLNMLQSLLSRLQRESSNSSMFDTDQQNATNRQRYYHDQLNRVLRVLSKHHPAKKGTRMGSSSTKPFVAPFRTSINGEFNITPRLISYYEVSIHPKETVVKTTDSADIDVVNERRRLDNILRDNNEGNHRPRTQCLVVGLATSDFDLLDRMPGWDGNSIGYHGDDGGLFYGTGSMSRRIGPSFGVGDTVGCGIDYSHDNRFGAPCAFFTLNGSILGYEPIRSEYLLNRDLYPVIGIDTNTPITCNFGISKPFVFDLMALISSQKESVLDACSLDDESL